MNRILFVPAFALLLGTGCVGGNALTLGEVSLSPSCPNSTSGSTSATGARASGFLDVAGSTAYLAEFTVGSNIQGSTLTVGSTELTGASQHDVIVNQYTLSYQSTPSLGLADETIPLSYVVHPDTDSNKLLVNLIGPKAGQGLQAKVPTGGLITTLMVTLQLKGNIVSGGAVSSNPITFPIYLRNSDTSGCATTPTWPNSTCGNPGQDATAFTCGP